MGWNTLNLTNRVFGRLFVACEAPKSQTKIPRTRWLCICSCGNIKYVGTRELSFGDTKSCGCLLKEHKKNFVKMHTKHGMRNLPEYNVWKLMRSRCSNPQEKDKKYYAHIKVCKRWNDFKKFYKDMGPRPSDKHSIDRINGMKGYYPSNCRWADAITQSNNRSNVIKRKVNLCKE